MLSRSALVLLTLVLLGACARRQQPSPPASRSDNVAAVPPPSAASPTPAPGRPHVEDDETPLALPFIHDDYAKARAEARARSVPIFADVWASWCHTCLSLKSYVLTDPTLRPLAHRFVWLAIDSENRSGNAEFLSRFPTKSLPTLWVIDPVNEAPNLKWIGTATATELRSLLEDALHDELLADLAAARSPALASAAAEATGHASHGHRLSARGELDRAIDAYKHALERAPDDWPKRARTIEALSMRYTEAGRTLDAYELAVREAPAMRDSTARLNVVLNGIDASSAVPPGTPSLAALPELIAIGTRLATLENGDALLDDRSGLTLSLVHALAKSNPAESQRLARGLSERLDAAAASAKDIAARMVWDPHRVEAYIAIGEAERAIPMLEQSERERPDDYNPPARLARVHLTLKQLPEARAAIDRALARSDGPRKLRLYMLKADILVAAKDKRGARKALAEALAFARRSQLPAQYDKLRESIERKAQELS